MRTTPKTATTTPPAADHAHTGEVALSGGEDHRDQADDHGPEPHEHRLRGQGGLEQEQQTGAQPTDALHEEQPGAGPPPGPRRPQHAEGAVGPTIGPGGSGRRPPPHLPRRAGART
ncbi:hypothetical protein [Georgenia muralis]